MIELRWAQRVGRNPRAGPYTVLEYRVFGEGILMTPDGEVPHKGWSEWMAVPTVWLGRSDAAGERSDG
jgi:hypothetical protein